jgi:carboxypeptidase C (cathepsin A)
MPLVFARMFDYILSMHRLLLSLAIIGCLAASAFAADPTPDPTSKDKPAEAAGKEHGDKDKDKDKDKEKEPPPPVVTEHTITLSGGRVLKYKATAGYLTLRDTTELKNDKSRNKDKDDSFDPLKGKPKAQVFFVAYTLDPAPDPATRPVTFSFNGGPGSSSIWLHMGALGPRRAQLTDEGEAPPPPYKIVDNDSTWLDLTDLVFIDPVSTGYSRAAAGQGANQFHGYKEDVASVAEFIRLYVSHDARWSSPKFIVGESYGTTRAAALSDYLQENDGIYLNGIALVSSVLDFETISFDPGNNLPYTYFLPSYTAAAWYHKRLPPDLQAQPLADVLKSSEQFAANDYLLALAHGDAVPPDQHAKIADNLARFTGLPAAQLAQQNLRETDAQFFMDLLKDKNRSIGRFDARYTGIRYTPGTDDYDFDPSDEAVNGPFTSAFNDYVRRELKYESDLPYNTDADVDPWDFSNVENSYLDVAEDLRKAMSRHPYLKVWVCCGYYDLATPYFAAEHVVNQMHLDPEIRPNIALTYYDAGHMVYLRKVSREKFRKDFEAFLNGALHEPPVTNTER